MPNLETYRNRRDFASTPEPQGGKTKRRDKGLLFVVQRHAARRLHFDFRLEWRDVLLSWAVPRGPSDNPNDKRLAVRTEDHPLDYADFEGRIPQGHYGAGEVRIWDRGGWFPIDKDVESALAKGRLRFRLEGERYRGDYVLARMPARPKERQENWLLIKTASEELNPDAEKRGSVISSHAIAGAKRCAMPAPFAPQLARLVDDPPKDSEAWLSEIKYDGYRIIARLEEGKVRLLTRNGLDWTRKLRPLARSLESLGLGQAILDGEITMLGKNGLSDFGALAAALGEGKSQAVVYWIFDLLYIEGWDLRNAPLIERKRLLQALLEKAAPPQNLRYSDHILGITDAIVGQACGLKLEGVIAKRIDAPYRSGRTGNWIKLKCLGRDEFLVIGFTDPKGDRPGFGALHLGVYDDKGQLHYVGGIGTGYAMEQLRSMRPRLDALRRSKALPILHAGAPPPRLYWVEPRLVAEVGYLGMTEDHKLRHPVFLGLRQDKDPLAVRHPFFSSSRPAARKTSDKIIERAVPARAAMRPDPKTVTLTHPDKILWPEQGLTKADLAAYWHAAAPYALPHIQNRPLALLRCPDGERQDCFFQKNPSQGMPDAVQIRDTGSEKVLWIKDEEGLQAFVQMGVIEIHPWGSTLIDIEKPDRLIFDLDPDENLPFDAVIEGAQDVRARLAALGISSFCKTTGGKGLHVTARLRPTLDWDQFKAFARAFAEGMAKDAPKRYTASLSKRARTGRIFVDYLRNGRGATAVAPYSPRARPVATIALPLKWDKVVPGLDPQLYTLQSFMTEAMESDPWADFFDGRQSITKKALRSLGLGG